MGSKSKSSQATTNNDNRVAVDGGIGLSASDGNTISVTTSDPVIVSRALDSVDVANAGMSEGFERLLNAAGGLFDRGESLIGQTQKAVADAYGQAQNDARGTIDNRTMIVLAVAGAAALVLARR